MDYEMRVQGAPDFEEVACITRSFSVETTQLCRAMVQLGMASISAMPDFPANDHLERYDFHDGEPITDRARTYTQALERIRVDHGTHGSNRVPGIPTHKLTCGDSWHVTAIECAEAIAAYEVATAAGAAHPDAFADDVIPFLRTAARYQGFRVT